MSLELLFILAVVAMACLAVSRVVRVRLGRPPHPEGLAKLLFVAAFLIVPPLALGALVQALTGSGGIPAGPSVLLYVLILAAIASLMWIVAVVVNRVGSGSVRRLLVLALVGRDGDPDDLPYDPPVTATLAEGVARVAKTNAAFPRGLDFPIQIERADFRGDWDALDAATRTLEGGIAADRRLGLAVASTATAVAQDARSRLDTLRRLAVDDGQVWATSAGINAGALVPHG
jgi:hypothetical protein